MILDEALAVGGDGGLMVQEPATVVKLAVRLAGQLIVVVQVYQALDAVILLQVDP